MFRLGKPSVVEPVPPRTDAPKSLPTVPSESGNGQASDAHESAPASPTSRPLFKTVLSDEVLEAPGFEADPGQANLPILLGLAALLIGAAGAGARWVTVFNKWSLYIAIAGAVLGFLGIVMSLARRRAGLLLPIFGTLICLAAVGQPWVTPLLGGPGSPGYQNKGPKKTEQDTSALHEGESRGILSVEWIRPTPGSNGVAADYSYKLSNQTLKAIRFVHGSIQIYDRQHNLLCGLGLDINSPIAAGGAIEQKSTWSVDPRIQDMIAGNQTTAEFRVDTVTFSSGIVQTFEH